MNKKTKKLVKYMFLSLILFALLTSFNASGITVNQKKIVLLVEAGEIAAVDHFFNENLVTKTGNYGALGGSNDGLVGYWNFNEGTGNIAYDTSGQGNDATIDGATFIPGVSGTALQFDGEDDFVTLPRPAMKTIGSLPQGTIAFWFNYNYNLDEQALQPLFYIGEEDSVGEDYLFVIEIGHNSASNEEVYVTWITGEAGVPELCYDTGFNLEEHQWYHFAVVVGPEGNTGYLDGVELVDRWYNYGHPEDDLFLDDILVKNIFTFGLGRTGYDKTPELLNYDGLMDEVMIYDRALTAGEIQELYELTWNQPPDELVLSGPHVGIKDRSYEFILSALDPDDDQLYYNISWGDGTFSGWFGPSNSGQQVPISHTWERGGIFTVRFKAKDVYGAESEWSAPHTVFILALSSIAIQVPP